MTQEDRMRRALLDPASEFETPDEVLAAPSFTEPEKIEILRRWEYDASELSVAEEEGMPSRPRVTVAQVLQALHHLGADIDVGRSPPTKQGGLDRAAVKVPKSTGGPA